MVLPIFTMRRLFFTLGMMLGFLAGAGVQAQAGTGAGAVTAAGAAGEEDLAKAKAGDGANLRKIWEALAAYQKAKGEYPAHLGELVPGFLPEAKVLVSPLGVADDPEAAVGKRDPKFPCSYKYSFNTDPLPGEKATSRDWALVQVEEYGKIVPILQCDLYERTLNVSVSGEFFESGQNWAADAEILKRLDRDGWGPGIQKGKKLMVLVTDPKGRPVPNVTLETAGRRWGNFSLPWRKFTTDAAGSVTLPLGPEARTSVTMYIEGGEWVLPWRRWNFGDEGTVPGSDVAKLTVVAQPAGPVGGIVRDPAGRPLAGAYVTYTLEQIPGQPDSGNAQKIEKTDAEGRWKMEGIPRADPKVGFVVRHGKYRTWSGKVTEPPTAAMAALLSEKGDVSLTPLIPVAGRVVANGRPLAGAKVSLCCQNTTTQQATTDADGVFHLGAQEERAHSLAVLAEGWAPTRVPLKVEAEMKPTTVEMEAGRALTLRVMGGGRVPLAGAPVLLRGFAGNALCPAFHLLPDWPVIGTTGADGRMIWKLAPKAIVYGMVIQPNGDPFYFQWDGANNQEFVVKVEQ